MIEVNKYTILQKAAPAAPAAPVATGTAWLDLLLNSERTKEVQLAALLAALGVPMELACTCYSDPGPLLSVGRLTMRSEVEDLVVDLIRVMRRTPHERLVGLTESAIAYKERVMMFSDSPQIKDKVASEVLDRVMGRPTQTVISHNLNTNLNTTADIEKVESELSAIQNKIARIEQEREKLKSPDEVGDKTIDV